MPTLIRTIDESTIGTRETGPTLELTKQHATVREIIATRIRQEVESYNLNMPSAFRGLVQPTDAEQRLNNKPAKHRKKIDVNRQIATAVKAFESGSLLVLLPKKQADDLDEIVHLADDDEISFLRLVPLIGG